MFLVFGTNSPTTHRKVLWGEIGQMAFSSKLKVWTTSGKKGHPIFWNIQFLSKTTLLFQVQFSRRSEGPWCFGRRFVVFFCAWSYDPTRSRGWGSHEHNLSKSGQLNIHPMVILNSQGLFYFKINQLNLSTYLSMYPFIYEQCIHKEQAPIYLQILMTHSWIESPEPLKTTAAAATTTTTTTTVGWFVELRAEVLLSVCAARNMNYAQLQWTSQDPVGLAPLELYTAPTMKRAGIQYQKGRTLQFSPSLLLFLYQISFIKLQIICDRLCFEGSPYQLLSPFN